jgi:hypothetical protein
MIADIQVFDHPMIARGNATDAREETSSRRNDLNLPDSVRQTFSQGLDQGFLARPTPKVIKLSLVFGQLRQPPLLTWRKNCSRNFAEGQVRVKELDVNANLVTNCNGRQDYAVRM